MARRRVNWRGLGLLAVLVAGSCGDEPASTAPEPLPAESLPGVYTGVFPCDGCPGIATTLWIRADGRFFFEQRYPPDGSEDETTVYGYGRWALGEAPDVVHLDGKGPRRTFERTGRDSLLMQVPSDLEHRLNRNVAVPEFAATVRMTGTLRSLEGGIEFAECLTGYAVPVTRGGDFSRFQHQYRSAGGQRGPVFAELEGRFSWSDDGTPRALTIERFVTIRADGSC